MRKFLTGLIVGLIAVPAAVLLYFATGSAPVATAAPAMPLERLMAGMALHARMDKEMPKSVPIGVVRKNHLKPRSVRLGADDSGAMNGMP